MRILYIAPRMHPNQIGIINGWKKHGDEVFFLSRKIGNNEDHSVITPDVIGYSKLSEIFIKLYMKLKKNDEYSGNIDLIYGFPSSHEIKKYLLKIKPDVVVLREKSIYSIVCYSQCKKLGIKGIIYNQTPLFIEKSELNRDYKHKLVDRLLPKVRITPVYEKLDGKMKDKDSHAVYIPFVVEPKCPPEEKTYFKDGKINIIDIGKFEKRKNHILLLKVFKRLCDKYDDLKLIIAGNMDNDNKFAQIELSKVKDFLKENSLDDKVSVLVNVSRDNMDKLYRESDLYILPSTSEPAAVSHLEAMSYSIPAVCSTGNATASYILDGISGEVFKDNDEEDLYIKIDTIISNRNQICRMGKEAYNNILENFSFEKYYDAFMKCMLD